MTLLDAYAEILPQIIAEPETALEDAVRLVRDVKASGNKLFFIGNGGSAAIASHMAADFQKAASVPAMCFNDPAAVTALANDCGYNKVFAIPLKMHAREGDVLFAISSSGYSESITSAVNAAARMAVRIITLSGMAPQNPLRQLGAIAGAVNFYVPSYSYGVVETTHLAICHAILDRVIHVDA